MSAFAVSDVVGEKLVSTAHQLVLFRALAVRTEVRIEGLHMEHGVDLDQQRGKQMWIDPPLRTDILNIESICLA